MFCPKCGSQQINDEIRFCSRCGFQLNVVKALLADETAAAPAKAFESAAPDRARRKKDTMLGAALMAVFALHTAWTTEDLSLDREYASLIFKCLLLCAAINVLPVLRSFFRGGATPGGASLSKMPSRLAARFKQRDQDHALPAADGAPAAGYFTGRVTAAEFVQPPSVTEDTTDLLRRN